MLNTVASLRLLFTSLGYVTSDHLSYPERSDPAAFVSDSRPTTRVFVGYRTLAILRQELPSQHRNRFAGKDDAVAVKSHAHDAAPRGCLIADHFGLPYLLAPIRPQATMGRAGYRVFHDARFRREETRNEIKARRCRSAR